MLKADSRQQEFENFVIPFGGKLNRENRWVVLSNLVPWDLVRSHYEASLDSSQGAPSLNGRIAFGALLIKEKLGLVDREVVEQIVENPYLQYFLGYEQYSTEKPFDASMMVHFRKRFREESLREINEQIIKNAKSRLNKDKDDEDLDHGNKRKGKLLIDATCAPADMSYPTDLNLLNEAREKSENLLDVLFSPLVGKERKPRNYRKNARKDYLKIIHNRQGGFRKMRKAIGKQLNYLKRNLTTIDSLLDQEKTELNLLNSKELRQLWIIRELYNQQQCMYENRKHTHPDRIVSLSQPHVRAIVRGKARNRVEFGAKLSLSYQDGYSWIERISWDAYNECHDLKAQVEAFKKRNGHYPEVVCADKIYRTRENRNWCNQNGIRLSGRGPGRPKKDVQINKERQKQIIQDERSRIPVEGKFGQAKRRFGLSLIKSKLAQSSITSIMMSFIVINLQKIFFVPITLELDLPFDHVSIFNHLRSNQKHFNHLSLKSVQIM